MNFIEVWSIDSVQLENGIFKTLLIVGILFVIIESIAVISRKYGGENSQVFRFIDMLSKPKYPWSLIFYPIGIISIILGIYLYNSEQKEIDKISEDLNSPYLQMVEGLVNVEFEQPESGRTDGDIIHVADKTFELSYFFAGYYYKETISQGGVLTDDKYVRIYYIPTKRSEERQYRDGKIVKIEVRDSV